MSTQIFKNTVPNDLLFSLLDKICIKEKNYYIINNISFKKGMYNDTITIFLKDCREYYHCSKQKYIDRDITYNSFITIIRQICNYNKILYKNQIKYDKSKYSIHYYIYYSSE
jgi:hypothetical protein